jgi:sterol desaturase/sphingolipid hydroxylase (fatty acid hydroxylase superfamily)
MTEDQLEGAVILYFTIILLLLVSGVLMFALCRKKWLKAAGALIFVLAVLGGIKFMDVLDWMYPVLRHLP